jgi:hypothetical protein
LLLVGIPIVDLFVSFGAIWISRDRLEQALRGGRHIAVGHVLVDGVADLHLGHAGLNGLRHGAAIDAGELVNDGLGHARGLHVGGARTLVARLDQLALHVGDHLVHRALGRVRRLQAIGTQFACALHDGGTVFGRQQVAGGLQAGGERAHRFPWDHSTVMSSSAPLVTMATMAWMIC